MARKKSTAAKKAAKPKMKKKEVKAEQKIMPAKLEQKPIKPAEAKVEVIIKKNTLGEAPEEFCFVLSDGQKLKSLFDLAKSLDKMTDDMFNFHVNESKNDFSSWINDVFEMPDLAKEISSFHSKVDTELAILKKLVNEMKKEVMPK
jgi:hypothetical protein